MNEHEKWDLKYLREQPYMAFGSMMNAYSNINHGVGLSVKEFEESSESIFRLACKLTEERFSETSLPDSSEGKLNFKTLEV